jgi:thymidylate synthase (FAD)
MNTATLVHMTPDADEAIAKLARVSNPQNENNTETAPRLIRYLIDHNHWSPFETVHATVEIITTRDIGRQILRHRSFSFQEFSGRYAAYDGLLHERMMRYQDPENRQSSVIPDGDLLVDPSTKESKDWVWWCNAVDRLAAQAEEVYAEALNRGIAKEVARSILPEGLVPTRMYMAGSIRSWIHYCRERLAPGVQYEHQLVAGQIYWAIFGQLPMIEQAIVGYVDAPSRAQARAHMPKGV